MPHFSRFFLQAAFFLLLALAVSWPLPRHLTTHLPLGTEEVATVPLFNVWTIWWNSDRAAHGYDHYWDAPIFFPEKRTFSFSEPMLLTGVMTPLIKLSGNRIVAYNLALLLFLWLNGLVACRVLSRLDISPLAAWLGGALVALAPLIQSWLGVLQLVPVFGILLSLETFFHFSKEPTVFRGIKLGLYVALTYLLCSYYGLYLLAVLSIVGMIFFSSYYKNWRAWAGLAVGAILCILCILPVIAVQKNNFDSSHLVYQASYLAELSAHPVDYLYVPFPKTLHAVLHIPVEHAGFHLCPGLLTIFLAIMGCCCGLSGSYRRWTFFCVTVATSGFILSFGPLFHIGTFNPYLLLVEYVPGFGQARNVFRFSILANLMVPLLAAVGLHGILVLMAQTSRKTMLFRNTGYAVVIVLTSLAVGEALPPSQSLYRAPDMLVNQAWTRWLRNNSTEQTNIVCIPFAFRPDVASYEQEAVWMYFQTFHKRRMLNGYSGFFPKYFIDFKWTMRQFPLADSLEKLIQAGIHYVVAVRSSPQGLYLHNRYQDGVAGPIKPVFSDSIAGIDIYQLQANGMAHSK